ncbi:MAG: ubiquinol oxidase subunit II [Caldimonas sp.]
MASAALALTACGGGVLNPQGPVGAADMTILIDSLVIMLAIVVPTLLAVLGVAWWFRASNERARYRPQWAFSGRVELVVWAIPLMVIVLLGGVAWLGAHALDPAEPLGPAEDTLDVQVVSLDWKWLFIYPKQGVASINRLVIPAGVPVRFALTSSSVMNAFFVPQLGSMIYTMNGMTSHLNLKANAPGTFAGLSAHYSGDGFSDMHFEVRALAADQFTAWVDATRASGPALDETAYAALRRQTLAVPASTYASVDARLFEKIVALELEPGPGPATKHRGAIQVPAEQGH